MVVKTEFWRTKRVFVTGHTGFKGAWLSLWLEKLGAKVTGYALAPPSKPNLFEVANIAEGMTSIIADIGDYHALRAAVDQARPEIIIHMAAQSLVRFSYANPIETYATNVLGTVHLLESVRHTPGIKAVLNVTSDKCYENREWVWGYREDDPMGGYDPYSSSKGCAELVTAAYRRSYFTPTTENENTIALASVRAGNVIGGGDWGQDRLIPDIVRAIESGQKAVIRNPEAVRPWQHVLEPLSGYLRLAQALYEEGLAFSEAWNFGPRDDDAQPVAWLAEKVTHLWGNRAAYCTDPATADRHEANYLKLDCSKARARLKWQPRMSLDRALEMTVAWYEAYFSGKQDMRALSLAQIAEYDAI